jgi:hypothetical protein
MIEITNTSRSPAQIMVRSKRKLRSFTTLVIPGRGKGHNKVIIEDEAVTNQIKDLESDGIISTKRIRNIK